MYIVGLGRMPMSNSLGRGTSLCGNTLSRRFEPVGHTNVQAPQVMHASLFRSYGVSTRIPAPRPTKSAAPTPMRSRHTRTHRPHRMQSSFSIRETGGLDLVDLREALEGGHLGAPGQQQLDGHPPAAPHALGVRVDRESVGDLVVAGGDQAPPAVRAHLHQAHPAGAVGLHRGVVAQGRNADALRLGRFEDRLAPLGLHLPAVDGQGEEAHAGTPTVRARSMASNRHASKQAPHLMHSSCLIRWGCLRSPSTAFTGQAFLHAMQPVHDSAFTT